MLYGKYNKKQEPKAAENPLELYHQSMELPADSHKGVQIPYFLQGRLEKSPTGGCYSKLGLDTNCFFSVFFVYLMLLSV